MEPILTIDNLNSFGGNMLRQGDKSQLKYRLRDVGNKNLGISSKSCDIKMYGRNYTTVVYETTTTVSSDNTVSFTINKVLPKGTFYLEFTVGDYIFPTDHREYFEITPSGKGMEANIIEIVGKDVLIQEVKSQVDTELQPLVTSLESAQQAETQRASAESSRESAEAQRKVDHENRSAELAGKADKVVLKNLIENGDFSEGLVRWGAHQGGEIEVVDSRLRVYTSETGYSGATQTVNVNYDIGDIIYTNISVDNPNDHVITLNLQYASNSNFIKISPTFNGAVSTVQATIRSGTIFSYFITKNHESGQFSFSVDNVILLNLTKTFGVGNEPSVEEMDELIKVTGYIDGEYALNNKEMLIWTLALIRRNKNAIVALGGA